MGSSLSASWCSIAGTDEEHFDALQSWYLHRLQSGHGDRRILRAQHHGHHQRRIDTPSPFNLDRFSY
jgi:hypothetical protein